MQPDKWIKIKDLFSEAVKLEAIPRKNFLSGINDVELRGEVEKLISADEEAATINNVFTVLPAETEEYAGKLVGNYRIIKEVGAGGMGSVFLAEREDFEKQVALKIVKHEFSSKELRRRFQTERQILATLEHPNIAHLLDGGTTESGLPYFVLEYIEGEDLLSYCEKKNLSVKSRLDIFRKVCSAVAYAHSRLVVHRDLKPSNILVTKNGEPKLLDFGISKLVNQTSFEETGTATALGMMTPNYASPEQFRGESVTTATDIYSLGVILYELLTDNLPYAVTNNSRLDEVARAVCEKEPTKPSSIISGRRSPLGKETNVEGKKTDKISFVNQRLQNPKLLKGDLDNIILKSLRKEPTRRYSSVEKFSDDIRRHLEGLPVSARPATFSYRAEKFFKRNRVAVIAAAIVLLTLVGGIVGTTWQAIRAERQRKIAEKRFNDVRQLANNVVFKYYEDIKNLPGSTKARQTLVNDATVYLDNLSQDESDDLSLQRELARAYQRVGDVQGEPYQANIGDTAGAIESYRKALKLFSDILNKSSLLNDRRELAQAQQKLAVLLMRAGSTDVADVIKNSVTVNEQIVAENPDSPEDKISLAKSYISLADIAPVGAGANESIPILQKALALVEPVSQSQPENIDALYRKAAINQRLGFHYRRIGETAAEINNPEAKNLLSKAAEYYGATIQLAEHLIKLDPQNANYKRNYSLSEMDEAIVQREIGENDKALATLLKVLKDGKTSLTSDLENVQAYADLGGVYNEIAQAYLNLNELKLADEYSKNAVSYLDIAVTRDADNLEYHRGRFDTMMAYSKIMAAENNFDQAIENYQTAFDQLRKAPISQTPESLFTYEIKTHDKIADTNILAVENLQETAAKKRERLAAAQTEYEKALDGLQNLKNSGEKSAVPLSGSYISDRYNLIAEKLSQTKTKLASV